MTSLLLQGQRSSQAYRVIRLDLLSNIVYIVSMFLRRTVSEILPFKVLGFELPILTLRSHSRSKVKGQSEFEKRSYMISYQCVIVTWPSDVLLREICDLSLEQFFWIPDLTLRGHRRSKIKVDLRVLGMGSYQCLSALSSTVWPQYNTRRTDGHARKKSPSYALCIACTASVG